MNDNTADIETEESAPETIRVPASDLYVVTRFGLRVCILTGETES